MPMMARPFLGHQNNGGNDSYTKILLHMDGSNGGTTFTDSAYGVPSAHTWTATSATTNTGTVKFGTASMNAGAGAGYIDTPSSSDFTFGSSDFTIDFWFNRQGGDGTRRITGGMATSGAGNLSPFVELTAANKLEGNSLSTVVTSTTTFTATGWNHCAFVRTGNTLKLFVNGTQEGGDVAFSSSISLSPNKYAVGRLGEFVTLPWNGFIDEYRLSIGIARWTANFTPPTSAYSP